MKPVFLAIAASLALSGCIRTVDSLLEQPHPLQSLEIEPPPSSSSGVELKETVLVDQSFDGTSAVSGLAKLRAIGTKKIVGNVDKALLLVELRRGTDPTGWSGVGFYAAPLDDNGSPDESVFGNRFRYIDAVWRGSCRRNLDQDLSFGLIEGTEVSTYVSLRGVLSTSGDDGCSTETDRFDLASYINAGGLALGFSPSNTSFHLKVTLLHDGDVVVTPL